jgi:hypothetical protein
MAGPSPAAGIPVCFGRLSETSGWKVRRICGDRQGLKALARSQSVSHDRHSFQYSKEFAPELVDGYSRESHRPNRPGTPRAGAPGTPRAGPAPAATDLGRVARGLRYEPNLTEVGFGEFKFPRANPVGYGRRRRRRRRRRQGHGRAAGGRVVGLGAASRESGAGAPSMGAIWVGGDARIEVHDRVRATPSHHPGGHPTWRSRQPHRSIRRPSGSSQLDPIVGQARQHR